MKIGVVLAGLTMIIVLTATPVGRRTMSLANGLSQPLQGIDPNKIEPTVIGMNTGLLAYWSSENAFADPIKNHGQLGWEVDPRDILTNQLKRDDQLHPVDVPAGAKLSAKIQYNDFKPIRGRYHCTISPGWHVESYLYGIVFQSGTKFTVDVAPNAGPIAFAMNPQKAGVSLDHLSCRYPDVKDDALFRPDFLNDMRPFRVLRFMDWMVTNNAPKRLWAQRPSPNSMEQISNGVAVEYMVALANELHSDPWFTLPLDTDSDYYRNFATYVRDHLDPSLKAYVELSNETWNDSFQQSKDSTARGQALYPGVSGDKANDYYYADRVRDLMTIWSDVFKGQQKRIVRVMASQMWAQRGDQRLGHKDSWKYVDALAVAPYWGEALSDVPGQGKERIDNLLARGPGYIDTAIKTAKENKIVAAKYGLPLIAYEGGPGFMAYKADLDKDIIAMESDPRFYDLYQSYLKRWQKEIGGLLVLYQGIAGGSFGHLSYTGQPLAEAPKMRAVTDFIAQTKH